MSTLWTTHHCESGTFLLCRHETLVAVKVLKDMFPEKVRTCTLGRSTLGYSGIQAFHEHCQATLWMAISWSASIENLWMALPNILGSQDMPPVTQELDFDTLIKTGSL